MKGKCIADLKTSHSQESQIDVFSRLETNFFEKYVKYTLTDSFSHFLRNIYEDLFFKKLSHKQSKAIATCLYQVQNTFLLQQLTTGLHDYFKEKSQSVSSGQFPIAIKFLHCNHKPVPNLLKQGELIYVDVRIKLQVARIEEIPNQFTNLLEKYSIEGGNSTNTSKSLDSDLDKMLKNYTKEYFNVFVVYYGDIHFDFARHQGYLRKTIKVGGRNVKLRLFVFYVSKVALFETFRSTNKLSVDCINDLAISFYEIKRQKIRTNKLKKNIGKKQNIVEKHTQSSIGTKTAVLAAVGSIVVGLVIAKVYFF